MILDIDTATKDIVLKIFDNDMILIGQRIFEIDSNQTEKLLYFIDFFLAEYKFSLTDIEKIVINNGPGGYTGVRVGVTTANFLAFCLNIPILSHDGDKFGTSKKHHFGQPVYPIYLNEPHITKPKLDSR